MSLLFPWYFLLSLFFFLLFTFLLSLLGSKMGKRVIRDCCCPCDLSKKLLSILRLFGSFLESEILLFGRSICLRIAECSISKLLTRSSSVSLHLLGIDKILDFSYLPPIAYLRTRFLRITTIQS